MQYEPLSLEKKWQDYWAKHQTYKVSEDSKRPKYYILDMFPYPSGAGLHVGHPLGYIASDIVARYKRMKGFNVLHPMGYDSFGLPAEQYAIQTGQHPAITTETNLNRYRKQLDRIGFSFDWSREVRTSDPNYYKWTQWAFIQMFEHWYDCQTEKALPIKQLIEIFQKEGNQSVQAATDYTLVFTAGEWNSKSNKQKKSILQNYRLAYQADMNVNWCPALGTVLANDEIKDGHSVRGNHPVEQKKMRQWCLRITAYAQRLLDGLQHLQWSEAMKETQKHWIGRSTGVEVDFQVAGNPSKAIKVFTTRPNTLFGCTFMVIAPESEVLTRLVTSEQRAEIDRYLVVCKQKSERERLANTKQVTGVFTGSYCIHPLTNEKLPVWTADYVLDGYGTGAVMAVPAHDSRDYAFAKKFALPIVQVIQNPKETVDVNDKSYDSKDGVLINSEFLNGLTVKQAHQKMIDKLVEIKIGKKTIYFRLRNAIFSRQRYWGEPIPICYNKEGEPEALSFEELPLELPEVDKYLPTEAGDPPLGRATNWQNKDGKPLELNTMPGFAGSSAYFLRYMDPHNSQELVAKDRVDYWQNVDLYIGGNEHATGHLIYSRFWNMFLYDIGVAAQQEPFQKMINQGMIQGRSSFVYRVRDSNKFVSYGLKDDYETSAIHVDVSLVKDDILDVDAFRRWRSDLGDATFILEDGIYKCGSAVEKMSKSLFNVVNPDDVIERYGADTLRLYEMFLGPIEQSKPWNTSGIDGVHRFLNKLWKLFYSDKGELLLTEEKADLEELRIVHTLIKKVNSDVASFSLNTSVSAFMICVNDLSKKDCHKRDVLSLVVQCLAPFAPHMGDELWRALGHDGVILDSVFPEHEDRYLVEDEFSYPVSFNGKMRFQLPLPLDLKKEAIQEKALQHERTQHYLGGKDPKKIIVVPGKIINIVV